MNDTTDLDAIIATAKKHDRPPTATQERAWIALSSAVGAGAPPPSVGEPQLGSLPAAGGVGIKGLVTLVVAGAGLAIALAITAPEPPVTISPLATWEELGDSIEASVAAAPPSRPQLTIVPESGSRADDDHVAPIPPPPAPASKRKRSVASDRRSGMGQKRKATPARGSTLAQEARLLGRAWKAADSGNGAEARRLVREHTQRFPSSSLAPERQACGLVARCLIDASKAAVDANKFVSSHGGALAKRVEHACKK